MGGINSCGRCKKLAQIWWLKATEMSSLTVWEGSSLKPALLGQSQGTCRAVFLPEALGQGLFPSPSSWCLLVLLGSLACTCLTAVTAFTVASSSPLPSVSRPPLPSSCKDTCGCIWAPSG